jgi:hypothetical protein
MKLLFENWRKLLEGDVIDISHLLPQEPEIDYGPNEEVQESLQLVIKIEDMAANRLAKLHGNHAEIPIEKINALEKIIDDLEALLKR